MDFLFAPWPWYVSGPLIALTMFTLLYMGKNFGMSSNLRTACTLCGAGKTSSFFKSDWKSQQWNLLLALGAAIGGYLGATYFGADQAPALHPQAVAELQALGIHSAGTAYLPTELFSKTVFQKPKYLLLLITGGFLVGFGARYAGGCTSGHSISGISNLQVPSMIATGGFFVGGMIMIYVFFPLIF